MITLRWRASGVRSKMSLSITVATRQGNKPSGRSLNISRYSTIGRDGRNDWGTYPRLSMSGSSMQGRLLHENISCPLLTSGVSHNEGRSAYTKSKVPWKLIHQEVVSPRSEAMKRERKIKRMKSREHIERLVKRSPA